MALGKMLDDALNDAPPESQPEKEANFYEIKCVKDTIKEWLKSVGLPDYESKSKYGITFSSTESLRQLLIILVDEP